MHSKPQHLWIINGTYSLQAWYKPHAPGGFQWTVHSIFTKKMFTNLHPFISTSAADPIIYIWSQISDYRCTILDIQFVKENNVHIFIWLSYIQTTIKQIIPNNPDIPLGIIWIPFDSFRYIIHSQALSILGYTLPPTRTLELSLFKTSEFGDAVDSHQFGLFLFNNINTTWNQDSELINKTTNPIKPSKSKHSSVCVHHNLTETANFGIWKSVQITKHSNTYQWYHDQILIPCILRRLYPWSGIHIPWTNYNQQLQPHFWTTIWYITWA